MHNRPYPDAASFRLQMRQNSPYTLSPFFQRIASAKLIYQPCELQQIRHAAERTIPAYDDLRVGSHDISPLRRNRADPSIIDSQQETSSITVVSLAHANEFLAAERMERMRDTHKTHRCA